MFAVPYLTLQNVVQGKNKYKIGEQNAHSLEEETQLVDGIQKCAHWGFPFKRSDILNLVQS